MRTGFRPTSPISLRHHGGTLPYVTLITVSQGDEVIRTLHIVTLETKGGPPMAIRTQLRVDEIHSSAPRWTRAALLALALVMTPRPAWADAQCTALATQAAAEACCKGLHGDTGDIYRACVNAWIKAHVNDKSPSRTATVASAALRSQLKKGLAEVVAASQNLRTCASGSEAAARKLASSLARSNDSAALTEALANLAATKAKLLKLQVECAAPAACAPR